METASNSSTTQTQDLKARVQEVLNTIRPALQADGGDCDLVDVTADGIVQLRLRGACGSCRARPSRCAGDGWRASGTG